MAKEKTREANIIDWIKERGGDAFSVHGGGVQRTGEPDIAGGMMHNNRPIHFKIEVKKPEGKASELQNYQLSRYNGLLYCVGILTHEDQMPELVETYFRWIDDGIARPYHLMPRWIPVHQRPHLNLEGWVIEP